MRHSVALSIVVLSLGVTVALHGQDSKPVADEPAPKSPAEAFRLFKVADDLRLETVLTEPTIAQPVFLTFDERGRMWVVQYLQYPLPAGLKILSQDKHLRATYDKVPPPPPHHFPGRDKITIHEDTDGDGTYDRHKTFVDGLNIANSCAPGRGGVWVLNPPYLLFYPDRDGDDVPDGAPEVHLEGFGLEDTHSSTNSLQWGPDGWLYSSQGSTVTGRVRQYGTKDPPVHSMGQLIWRYHPETRRYEIFAEGGGNAYGVEIDAKGRLFSGHNGGDTRGFYYVQGAYLQRSWQKHGVLTNPYAFGYFAAMKHPPAPRFTHNFIVYEGAALPARYHGKLFGVAPLLNYVVCSERFADGSSFQTRDVSFPVTTSDPWFRPVDVKLGPDGGVYVADFYEGQIAHLRHYEGKIDTSNGRIYRLLARDARPMKPFDYRQLSTAELVNLLQHPNKWHRRMALRLLGDRKDRSAIPLLHSLLNGPDGQTALEALWGLNLCGGFSEVVAWETLQHTDPFVRLWTVRLLGDANRVSALTAQRLAALAAREPHVEVRLQLACTAKRLAADAALPILRQLVAHHEDTDDIYLPLLLWWALESKCEADRQAVLNFFQEPAVWHLPLVQKHLLHRLMRRFAAAGTQRDLLTCARLLQLAPDDACGKRLVHGFEQAFQGRPLGSLPPELTEALARSGGGSTVLALRQGKPDAVEKALAVLADDKADSSERLQYVQVFAEVHQPRCVPVLLNLLERAPDDNLRMAALTALQAYDDPRIGPAVLAQYARLTDDARATAQTLLTSRKVWALLLVEAVDSGRFDKSSLPPDVVRRLTVYRDDHLSRLVTKHWGDVEGATTAAMQQQIARLESVLRNGSGNPYPGKKLYMQACARCHKLFSLGGEIGPDLTAFKRDDLTNMLLHIVNPSAEIREGFETLLVTTKDGRMLTGFVVDKDNRVLVLRGVDGQTVTIRQEQVEEILPQRRSLMPEGLLKDLSDQQVRDLFAYLRSTQPLND